MSHLFLNNSELHDSDSEKLIFKITNFPVKMGVVENESSFIFEDLSFYLNTITGIVYIKPLIEPSFLYSNYHNAGTTGELWKLHHQEFAKFTVSDFNKYNNVLEIGGASGLLKNNINKLIDVNYVIIDPDSRENNNYYIQELFNESKTYGKYDAIIISHTLEHVINPISFLKGIKNNLSESGIVSGAIPNIPYGIKNGYTNAMHFEHHYFLDERTLRFIMSKAGLEVHEFKKFREHSYFFKARRNKSNFVQPMDSDYINLNLELFSNYENILKDKIRKMKIFMNQNKIYLFGAHIFSQFYLSMFPHDNFVGIIDNDLKKHNKILYGSNLKVHHPNNIKLQKDEVIVIDTGPYSIEIFEQLKDRYAVEQLILI